MTTLHDIRRWSTTARPVFICGLERSGTSILQVSLSRHPELFAVKDVYETFIFLKPRSALQDPAPQMTQAYLQGEEQCRRFRSFAASLSGGKGEISEADVIRAFFYFAAHYVYPGQQPLEKTPAHVRKLGRMLELFPLARVVVCTRDPVSIVASYRKRLVTEKALGKSVDDWGWLDRTAEQLIGHFEQITESILDARQRWPQQVFVAPYDWMTSTPEVALRAICEFAGLAFVGEVLKPKEVPGRQVDEMLSKPITRREPDIDTYVDAATERMILEKTLRMRSVWDRPGLLASSDF